MLQLTLNSLTESGNVAEYKRICRLLGRKPIISSNIPLKSMDNSLSALKIKRNYVQSNLH